MRHRESKKAALLLACMMVEHTFENKEMFANQDDQRHKDESQKKEQIAETELTTLLDKKSLILDPFLVRELEDIKKNYESNQVNNIFKELYFPNIQKKKNREDIMRELKETIEEEEEEDDGEKPIDLSEEQITKEKKCEKEERNIRGSYRMWLGKKRMESVDVKEIKFEEEDKKTLIELYKKKNRIILEEINIFCEYKSNNKELKGKIFSKCLRHLLKIYGPNQELLQEDINNLIVDEELRFLAEEARKIIIKKIGEAINTIDVTPQKIMQTEMNIDYIRSFLNPFGFCSIPLPEEYRCGQSLEDWKLQYKEKIKQTEIYLDRATLEKVEECRQKVKELEKSKEQQKKDLARVLHELLEETTPYVQMDRKIRLKQQWGDTDTYEKMKGLLEKMRDELNRMDVIELEREKIDKIGEFFKKSDRIREEIKDTEKSNKIDDKRRRDLGTIGKAYTMKELEEKVLEDKDGSFKDSTIEEQIGLCLEGRFNIEIENEVSEELEEFFRKKTEEGEEATQVIVELADMIEEKKKGVIRKKVNAAFKKVTGEDRRTWNNESFKKKTDLAQQETGSTTNTTTGTNESFKETTDLEQQETGTRKNETTGTGPKAETANQQDKKSVVTVNLASESERQPERAKEEVRWPGRGKKKKGGKAGARKRTRSKSKNKKRSRSKQKNA